MPVPNAADFANDGAMRPCLITLSAENAVLRPILKALTARAGRKERQEVDFLFVKVSRCQRTRSTAAQILILYPSTEAI